MPTVDSILGPPPKPKVEDLLGPPPAAAPKAAALKPAPYNPIKTFTDDFKRRTAQGRQEFTEGGAEGKDSSGTVSDPLAYAGGILKQAGGLYDQSLGAAAGAVGKVIAGKPLEAVSKGRIRSDTVGDATSAAAGFLVPGAKKVGDVSAEIRAAPEAAAVEREGAAKVPKIEDVLGPPAKAVAAKVPKAPKIEDVLGPAPIKTAKAKTMAAAEPAADREIVSTGPADGEGGPVVGNEPDAVERVDNALYRLGGHATADKLEAKQFLKSLPEEITTPEVQEDLYHAIEAKMADPAAEIPEHLKPVMQAMQPLYAEQTAIINRLRERNDPEIEPYLEDQGYIARRVKGYTPLLDQGPGTSGPSRDPIMGTKSLFKTAQAQKQRTAGFMATDADGKTNFWPGEAPEADLKGRPYESVRQATTKEIEANTQTRYHKNALVNTVDNVMRLRRVERNLSVLDEVTKNLKDEGKAWQSEWRHKDPATGQTIVHQANTKRPEGFQELPHVPQLRGWYFEPKVAQALKDYYPSPDEPLDNVLTKVNRMLIGSLFITPIPHAMNVGAHWTVGRGWDWMTPGGYRNLMKTGTKAALEVLTQGPKYKQMMREGSALLYGDTQVRDFHKVMLEKAGHEIIDDPKAVNLFAKAAGVPVDLVKKAYSISNKTLWAANDIFMLQRQLELEAKGMSPRKAISEAERDIPNYRIPPQVLKSRALAQAMKDPNLLMFGRYKYGQMKAWGTMFKDMLGKGEPGSQKEALGKFLVAMVVANGVYPIADAALKEATGNKDARVKRSGGFAPTDAAYQLATGQKDFASAMSSFINPSPLVETGVDVLKNRDSFTGQPLVDPGRSPAGQAVQAGEEVAGKFYPAGLAMQAMQPGGGASALGRLAGLELPKEGAKERREKYQGRERKAARKREAKDPMMKMIRGDQ